jgi:DNA-binding beta-propeller fold protein YncE
VRIDTCAADPADVVLEAVMTHARIVRLGAIGALVALTLGSLGVPAAASGGATCGATATPTTAVQSSNAAVSEAAGSPAAGAVLRPVADVPLPGGATRFDYQSFDPTSGRLWIAHMGDGELLAVDTTTRQVAGTVDGLPSVTGVLAVPTLHRVYAAVPGDHQVAVVDDRSLKVVARLGRIGFPDGLDFSPQTGRVFVSDESGGGEAVIDTGTDKVVATIDLGGEAGNTHLDAGSGCVLVAVQTRDELVTIDPAGLNVVDRIDLGDACAGPHGFLVDAAHRRAFVSCEDNATLLVVDLATKDVTATFDVGDRPDVLAFDPGLGRLYVASESGVVSVFAGGGTGLRAIGEYRAPHAHSVAVDPATHLVYLPLENVDGRPVLRIMAPGM